MRWLKRLWCRSGGLFGRGRRGVPSEFQDPWSRTPEQIAKDEQAMRDSMARFGYVPSKTVTINWDIGPVKSITGTPSDLHDSSTPELAIGTSPSSDDCGMDDMVRWIRAATAADATDGFEVYRAANGRWKWRMRINDVVVRVSPKSYSRKWSALRGYRRLTKVAA